jgi:DNA-binding transcriptional MerR regulator
MNGLRSGQVAQAAGVNQQTLRYYERRGLLAEPVRTPGGHRVYPAETVTVLRVIKAAQRLGFSLAEAAELLEAGEHRHRRQAGRGQARSGQAGSGLAGRAATKLAEVEAKIADLSVIADTLRAALATGCSDLMECAGEPRCPLPFEAIA